MAFKTGDTVFIVESNRFIREAEVKSCAGGMYLVKFKDNGGGIKLKEHRLFATKCLLYNKNVESCRPKM